MDSASGAPPARILLADDNADMRAYLTRLLSPHWVVEGVPDGATALAVAQERPPDLVLSDIMMPRMDGFALLRVLRADERTRTVPVMLLSARAGEEAAVAGLQAGADDYLVKPFTARELLARVAARLELARLRRETAQHVGRLDAVVEAIADAVFIYDAEGRITRMNTAARAMFALDARPEYASLPLEERMRLVHPRDEHGRPLAPDELPQRRTLRGEVLEGPAEVDIIIRALDGRDVQFNQSSAPVRDAAGTIIGAVAVCRDVTRRRQMEQRQRESLVALLAMAETLVRVDERALGSSTLDSSVNPVAQRLLELMLNVLGCRRGTIIALEPGTDVMRLVAMLGLTPEQEAIFWAMIPGTRIRDYVTAPAPFDRLIADEVVVLGERDVQFGGQPDPYGVRALLLAPLCVGERFAGVLVLDFGAEEHTYTDDELALARAVAKLAALVI